MKKLSQLFEIEYPKTLVFNEMVIDPTGINFISSKGTNNGIVCKVRRSLEHKEYPPNIITVPLKGTVLMASIQTEPCYVAHQVAVLVPKKSMSFNELVYYCLCIRQNRYRYNYGRQADRTLREILVPSLSEIPDSVKQSSELDFSGLEKPLLPESIVISVENWKSFRYDQLFDIKKGKRVTKLDLVPGDTPFLSAVDRNNGIREYSGITPMFDGNKITVNYNGSVGEAFYQENPFWASDDVNILCPKFELNKYIALFLVALIRIEKYRFNYGRKWKKDRMESSIILLPVDKDMNPDFSYMEKYIKTRKYSSSI